MSKKRNLIFICLLILGVFLITSCLPKPPVTEGILKGQVIVPEGSKQLTGQALADATVNIIDPVTGDIIATTTTDANGYYQVFVPAGGPYLLQAVKEGVKVQQFTPQVEVGIEYDLGTADCSTTAIALIVQAMLVAEDYPDNLTNINLADIEADPGFNDVMNPVCSIIEAGGDPALSAVIQQAIEDFLYPPAPAPAPTPTYTVTFDSQGGSAVDPQTVEHGELATEPTDPTKTGHTFGGWYKESGCTNAWDFDTDKVTSDVTLYAQWTINSYTVTFDKNGGDTEADPMIKPATHGGNVGTLPEAPTRTGYTFASWNAQADGSGTEFTATTAVTADLTVYAQWTINTYTVTFNSQGGSPVSSQTVEHGGLATEPTDPTRTGYTFGGWYKESGCINPWDFDTDKVTSNVTLFAKWTINTYTVTFDKNGGNTEANPMTKTATHGGNVGTLPEAPTRTGYTFASWNTQANGSGDEFTATTAVTADLTVYAQWMSSDATLSDLTVDGSTITGFDPATLNYSKELPYGTTTVPTVAATTTDSNAEAVVTQADNVTGTEAERTATVVVTAEDGTTQKIYTVTFSVAIGPLDHFTITGYPASTTAGDNFGSNNIVITAYDGNNKIKTDYTGTVVFSSSDGSAVLPGNYTFTSGTGLDNGVHTFPGIEFTLKTAGSQTITLTDGTVSVTSSGITVSTGSKNKLLWVTQPPSSVLTGATWNSFTIEITDAYGNRTSDTDEVTITPSSLSLGGTTTKAASSGLTIFDDITCSTAGTITITGSATGLTSTPASDTITIALPVHNLTKNTYYNTIQAALTDADTGDIIEADDGTYTESITFPAGKVITLRSVNGASSTTITGANGSATVTCTGSPNGTTLEGFTINHESGNTGMGITITADYLTINNCTISNNSATVSGGGIRNDGTLTITSSEISNNSASNSGGGIRNDGTLTITASTISNNSVSTAGGGIRNYGTLTITASTISNNSVSTAGGGICNDGTLTITGSTISNNTAGGWGGGIYVNSGSPTIGGVDENDTANFNTICGNTPDQIDPDTYPNNYIFTNCDVIGETGPAGGLIFYDKTYVSDGWRYLEAAPSDQSGPYHAWSNIIDVEIGTSAQGTAIGTGQANTTAIIAQPGHTESAAKLCDDLSIVNNLITYNDWFLPSEDELNLMYTNLHNSVPSVGGFADSQYWSSSEYDANFARYQNFANGFQAHYNKSTNLRVRAVRAF